MPRPSSSGCQMIGVRKNAICMTLATIGGISRNRAQNVPSSRQAAIESISQSSNPGKLPSAVAPGHIR